MRASLLPNAYSTRANGWMPPTLRATLPVAVAGAPVPAEVGEGGTSSAGSSPASLTQSMAAVPAGWKEASPTLEVRCLGLLFAPPRPPPRPRASTTKMRRLPPRGTALMCVRPVMRSATGAKSMGMKRYGRAMSSRKMRWTIHAVMVSLPGKWLTGSTTCRPPTSRACTVASADGLPVKCSRPRKAHPAWGRSRMRMTHACLILVRCSSTLADWALPVRRDTRRLAAVSRVASTTMWASSRSTSTSQSRYTSSSGGSVPLRRAHPGGM